MPRVHSEITRDDLDDESCLDVFGKWYERATLASTVLVSGIGAAAEDELKGMFIGLGLASTGAEILTNFTYKEVKLLGFINIGRCGCDGRFNHAKLVRWLGFWILKGILLLVSIERLAYVMGDGEE